MQLPNLEAAMEHGREDAAPSPHGEGPTSQLGPTPCHFRCHVPLLGHARARPPSMYAPAGFAGLELMHGARPAPPLTPLHPVTDWLNLLNPDFMAFLALFILAVKLTDSFWGFPLALPRKGLALGLKALDAAQNGPTVEPKETRSVQQSAVRTPVMKPKMKPTNDPTNMVRTVHEAEELGDPSEDIDTDPVPLQTKQQKKQPKKSMHSELLSQIRSPPQLKPTTQNIGTSPQFPTQSNRPQNSALMSEIRNSPTQVQLKPTTQDLDSTSPQNDPNLASMTPVEKGIYMCRVYNQC